jgi:hypothetical protein
MSGTSVRHFGYMYVWYVRHLSDTSDICLICQTPVQDSCTISGTSVRHFRYMSDMSDTCPRHAPIACYLSDTSDICLMTTTPVHNNHRYQGDLSDTSDICLITTTPVTCPKHSPIWGTSVRMSDMSDTCPRQPTDVREICQKLPIYVRYVRHLSKRADWCQGHLSDTSDICPICRTPVQGSQLMSGTSVRHFRYMSDMLDTSPWHSPISGPSG